MFAHPLNARVYSWLAALSLAAYGTFGVFGHSLHGLLPCGDDSCGVLHSRVEGDCCCDRGHATARIASTPATEGAEIRGAGHDAVECSLCTLLAKIRVGQVSLPTAGIHVGAASHEQVAVGTLLPADLILSGAPRGPPLA